MVHDNVRYMCRDCKYIHHPSERVDKGHFNKSACPKCLNYRSLIVRDKEGPVNYCEFIAKFD